MDECAFLILLVAFGCVNGLHDYPNITDEYATDLANDLLNFPDYNETEVYSPNIENLGDPILSPESENFGLALPLDE